VPGATVIGRVEVRLPIGRTYGGINYRAVLDVIHFQLSSSFPQILRKWLKQIELAGLSNNNACKKGIKTCVGANVMDHIPDLQFVL
jgi:hypothetical protein